MTPCILWEGASSHGYGQRTINRKIFKVHRLEWEKHHGPIPQGLQVLHKCDVRNCYNIDHLFLGTHEDNMKDKVNKGRQPRGSQVLNAIIDEELVRLIYQAYGSQQRIADNFGVSQSTVSQIKRKISWKHVTEDL